MFDKKLPFLPYHLDRLHRGMQYLKMNIPDYFNLAFFTQEIKKISQKNCRIKLTIFRNSQGHYTPTSNDVQFLIEQTPLHTNRFESFSNGLTIDICPTIQIPPIPLSNIKTNNKIPYILASIYCKENQLDDVLLTNTDGSIAEASSSNLFLVKDNIIYTPPLSSGCLDGILRQLIIEITKTNNLNLTTTSIQESDLETADEIWLSNSIQGLKWVKSYKNRTFDATLYHQMIDYLNDMIDEKNTRSQ